MSSLKQTDKIKLEKFFEMEGGYVCDFSDRTFGDFIMENTSIDVYDGDKYTEIGTSKANRLRSFLKKESNATVANLIDEMLEYWRTQKLLSKKGTDPSMEILYQEGKKIVEKLKKSIEGGIENIDAIQANSDDKNMIMIVNSIRESIKRDDPAEALDRLHTFVVKYLRELCRQHGLIYDKDTPLNALMGAYIKELKDRNLIESKMTEAILKSSIKILEAFNSVRNDQSLAHDNNVLNHEESVVIFNNIANITKFIQVTESKIKDRKNTPKDKDGDNITDEQEEEIDLEDITFDNNELTLEEAWDLGLI
jgi:hypothetical protein